MLDQERGLDVSPSWVSTTIFGGHSYEQVKKGNAEW